MSGFVYWTIIIGFLYVMFRLCDLIDRWIDRL